LLVFSRLVTSPQAWRMPTSQCKEAFCLLFALCFCMLMLLSDCRLRLCMFDACAALYREVHLLFAWMLCSDGFTACTDSVRRACIAVCLLIPPHIFFAFSEAQGYCFCAFSSGWRCAKCLILSFALRLISVDHFSAAWRVAMSWLWWFMPVLHMCLIGAALNEHVFPYLVYRCALQKWWLCYYRNQCLIGAGRNGHVFPCLVFTCALFTFDLVPWVCAKSLVRLARLPRGRCCSAARRNGAGDQRLADADN